MEALEKLKRIILIVVCMTMLVATPAFAADAENVITTELDSGWSVASNGYPYGSVTSWFNIIRQLILTGNTTLDSVKTQMTNYIYDGLGKNWTINGGYNALWGNGSWFNTVNSNLYTTRLAVQGLATASQMSGYFDDLVDAVNADTATIVSEYSTGVGTLSDGIDTVVDRMDAYFGTYNTYSNLLWTEYRGGGTKTAKSTASRGYVASSRFPVQLMYTDTGLLYTATDSHTAASPMDLLSVINNNLFMLGSEIQTLYTNYYSSEFNHQTGESTTYRAYSLMDVLDICLNSVVNSVGRLAYVFADDDAIALKNANKENTEAVVEDFFSPSTGGNSVKLSDIGALSDIGEGFSDALDTGGSVSGFLNGVSSSGGLFAWFTQDCADALDTSSDYNLALMDDDEEEMYDRYYHEMELMDNAD